MVPFISSRLLTAALRQDEVNSIKKQYGLTEEQIAFCNAYDPSPKNTYTRWLCKLFRDTEGDEAAKQAAITKLKDPLVQFMKLCNNPDFPKDKRDIGKYSEEELLSLVGNQRRYLRNLSPTAIAKLIKTEGLPGAKIIWDGGGYRMWYVTNADYAMILGSNTHWCTAANKGYAQSYTLKGGLYITYLNGKPFIQGHFEDGNWAFLATNDLAPIATDPDVIRMLDTIKHPIISTFKKICNGNFCARIRSMNTTQIVEQSDELLAYAKMADDPTVTAATVGQVWWPEGWEALLDAPPYLLSALEKASADVVKKLKDSDLREDLADFCMKNKRTELALFFGDDSLVAEYVKKVLTGDSSVRPTHFSNSILQDQVDAEGVKFVESLTNGDSVSINYIDYIGNDTIFTYWKKFMHKIWPEFDMALRNGSYPEYVKRADLLKTFKKSIFNLQEGESVIPGPDCPVSFTKGAITRIGENDTIEVSISKDTLHTFIQDDAKGIYQLARSGEKAVLYSALIPEDPDEWSTFKVGDVVVPGSTNNSPDAGEEYHGDWGEVIEVVEGEKHLRIKWDDDQIDSWWYPDPELFLLAVPSDHPRALCNWRKSAKEATEFKEGDIVILKDIGAYGAYSSFPSIIIGVRNDTDFRLQNMAGEMDWFDVDGLILMEQKPKVWKYVSPLPEFLAEGDMVVRGPDWRFANQDTKDMTREEIAEAPKVEGSVIGEVINAQTHSEDWNKVRWPSNTNSYQYHSRGRHILPVVLGY